MVVLDEGEGSGDGDGGDGDGELLVAPRGPSKRCMLCFDKLLEGFASLGCRCKSRFHAGCLERHFRGGAGAKAEGVAAAGDGERGKCPLCEYDLTWGEALQLGKAGAGASDSASNGGVGDTGDAASPFDAGDKMDVDAAAADDGHGGEGVAILRAAPKESPLRPRAPRKAVEVIDLISPEKAALFL